MTKNLLYAHILLDRSGSMESCRDSVIDAVNEYVNGLKVDASIDAAVSLSLFDKAGGGTGEPDIELVHDGVPVGQLPKLTRESFVPRGSTPLNDAIGRTVARIDKEWHRPGERIALVIVTDGMENASVEYKTPAIKALMESRRKDNGWLVIFLAANQDAFAEGAARGMAVSNTMNITMDNVSASMSAASRATRAYSKSGDAGAVGVAFTDDERKKAAGGPTP